MKLIIALLFTSLLSACNMVAGAGKDITNSSDWVKSKINSGSSNKESSQKSAPAKPSEPTPAATPATTGAGASTSADAARKLIGPPLGVRIAAGVR